MKGHPVFVLKHNQFSQPVCFKACWVCKGYKAVFMQDFFHTSSLTMRMEAFHVLLHLAA
ncbi:uncharacterized protein LAESUDRAFT_622735, partial [Laetiporus sulphureus 93-53]